MESDEVLSLGYGDKQCGRDSQSRCFVEHGMGVQTLGGCGYSRKGRTIGGLSGGVGHMPGGAVGAGCGLRAVGKQDGNRHEESVGIESVRQADEKQAG